MKAIKLEELKPSDIISVTMDSYNIVYLYYNYPILDEDVDYQVALYMSGEIDKLEKANGRALGLFVDIDHYHRLDCVKCFGFEFPSEKSRRLHSDLFKNSIAERAAFFKKNPSHLAEALLKLSSVYYNFKVRLFGDEKKAIKWLREGVQQKTTRMT